MKFRTTLLLDGKTATGIEIPEDVLESLGGGMRPPVLVTINGYTFRTTVGRMGGRSLVPVSADVRGKAGVQAGDALEVEIEPDRQPRIVAVPDDLAAALRAQPRAAEAFDRLSPSAKRAHVTAVEGAKAPQTRQRRVQKIVTDLAGPSGAGD